MTIIRSRKGLYYENTKLTSCYYNKAHCNFIQLLGLVIEDLEGDLEEIRDAVVVGFQALIWFFLLPVVPFIRSFYVRKHAIKHCKGKPADSFPKDYYEEISRYEDEEGDYDD